MTSDVEAAVETILAVSDLDERALLVRRLEESLHPADAAVNEAWRVELTTRIDGIRSGKVELLDVEESHAQLRAELAALRK